MSYKELEGKPNLTGIQDEVLSFWRENQIFEKSLKNKHGEVVFYDGPPFPTGKPHHGTVLVSFIKDMVARYWTMRGYSVPRVWGWDCHGLPIENQAEKLLGIADKSIIERSIDLESADIAATTEELKGDAASTGKKIEDTAIFEVNISTKDVENVLFGKVGRRTCLETMGHIKALAFVFSSYNAHRA